MVTLQPFILIRPENTENDYKWHYDYQSFLDTQQFNSAQCTRIHPFLRLQHHFTDPYLEFRSGSRQQLFLYTYNDWSYWNLLLKYPG